MTEKQIAQFLTLLKATTSKYIVGVVLNFLLSCFENG